MKKWLVIVLVLCMALTSGSVVIADQIDLGTLTDQEIIALLNQVQGEIVQRRIEKSALLRAGTYVGGKDLPVGSYILAGSGSEGEFGIISLRASSDPKDNFPSKLYEFCESEKEFIMFVSIDKDDTLVLPYAFNVTISSGALFK